MSLKAFASLLPAALLLVGVSACNKSRKPTAYPPNNGYAAPWYPQPVGTPMYTGPVYTNWVIPSATASAPPVPTSSTQPATSTTNTSAPPTPTANATVVIAQVPPSTGPRVPGPEAVIDRASVYGALADARDHVDRWQTPFLRCYALGLVNDPTMRGTVSLKLKVGTSGKITDAWKDAGGTVTYDVAACLLERTLADQFKAPTEPATLEVHVLLNPDHPKSG